MSEDTLRKKIRAGVIAGTWLESSKRWAVTRVEVDRHVAAVAAEVLQQQRELQTAAEVARLQGAATGEVLPSPVARRSQVPPGGPKRRR